MKFVYGGKTVTKAYAGADTVAKTLKATRGTVFTVSVRAYKKSGKQVFYGAWSAAKKVKVVKGDCFQCQKCTANCPKTNIHAACSEKLRGNELWFILLRAGLLFGLLFWLGKL